MAVFDEVLAHEPAPDLLGELNPAQRKAAAFGAGRGCGPLLIIAGAGSGKTKTLAYRVAHLLASGADAQRILLLTFSRRAAAELERRAATVLRQQSGRNGAVQLPWAGTFHSIGARLLREYAASIGLPPDFTIHDRSDSVDLMGLVRQERGLAESRSRFPSKANCVAIYSRCVNSAEPLAEVLRLHFPWCAPWQEALSGLFDAYIAEKQSQHVLDYDDLLLYWAEMVREPALARDLGERFDFILVDEYQDTNRLQADVLVAMKPDGAGVTVVGDDAQSIYAFRAATVKNILEFPQRFSLPVTQVTLEQNYRSTQPIIAACNAVIALASEGYAKTLFSLRVSHDPPLIVSVRDDAQQAAYVAERVLAAREEGIALKNQAVLFRASSHSAALELELARRNIPFVKFGGLKFLEAAHIKDLLSALRWLENPRSRMAGFRVLQLMPGIGPKRAQALLDAAQHSVTPWQVLTETVPPPAAASAYAAWLQLVAQAAHTRWPEELGALRRWYQPQLERLYDDAAPRALDLEQLERIAATYPSRERFLTEVTLDPPEATSDEAGPPLRDDDYLILSTIHSAKGQEWKAVYMLNVVDGCIPSDLSTGSTAEIEEERRLLYVGMTRAKDRLELIVPQRFYVAQQSAKGDRHILAARTRFIPAALAPHFRAVTWPLADPSQSGGAAPALRIDLGARLKGSFSRGP